MTKPKKLLGTGETVNCLSDTAESALRKAAILFSKDLSPELLEVWTAFLSKFSNLEIEFAFDKWMVNGHYFPKPVNIQQLVDAYRESQRHGIPKYANHGEGYGENDAKVLWNIVAAKRHSAKALTKADFDDMLDELDQVTGRAF